MLVLCGLEVVDCFCICIFTICWSFISTGQRYPRWAHRSRGWRLWHLEQETNGSDGIRSRQGDARRNCRTHQNREGAQVNERMVAKREREERKRQNTSRRRRLFLPIPIPAGPFALTNPAGTHLLDPSARPMASSIPSLLLCFVRLHPARKIKFGFYIRKTSRMRSLIWSGRRDRLVIKYRNLI